MKPNGYYTSGQFAKMAHITIRTVRYYDKVNILKPSYVSESGIRYYTDEDFAKLQQILLLKYLGFSLEDIRSITIGDSDHQRLKNSLNLQLKLVRDRIEQMQHVASAIEETTEAIDNEKEIDWTQMLNLIHLTNMENTLKTQYENSSNISARINLHALYSTNKLGWFPWVYTQCPIEQNTKVLEIGCGSGALWKENIEKIPSDVDIILNDISEGMLRDTRRELTKYIGTDTDDEVLCTKNNTSFSFHAFNCVDIPYDDESFDIVIANHLLFYCDDIEKVLSEVRRVLKSGGTFICSTYGAAHMKEITELVNKFNSSIILSADKLYERFGLDNGMTLLAPYFSKIKRMIYDDELIVDEAEPLIEYIISCHGNQNQYLLDRYKDFRSFVEKKTKKGFHITKYAGIFSCTK
ncbi:MAG: methyltransferase domain-containing protein [Lachnospiraceae bacterium]|nr:methyltransferase domain-containing protein [Lachnospiraceae bacterium]